MKSRKVTKAVFPVAGMGTRFLPATKSIPKEIMTLVDSPLIQYTDLVDGTVPQSRRTWLDLVQIAHRNYHRMPADMEPGLAVSHVMQVPTGGKLPTTFDFNNPSS